MFQNFEVDHRITGVWRLQGICTTQVCSKLWSEKHNISRNETMVKEAQSVQVFEQKVRNSLFEIF